MTAVTYDRLGAISGVTQGAKFPGSKRGRDRDSRQTVSFNITNTFPFTGEVILQGAVDSITDADSDFGWFDCVRLNFYGERDTSFVEIDVELAHLRVICTKYDARAVASSKANPVLLADSTISINGINVALTSGDDLSDIVSAINTAAIPGITVDASTVPNTILLYKASGTIVLADVSGSGLQDIGFIKRTETGPITLNPNGRINRVMTMR